VPDIQYFREERNLEADAGRRDPGDPAGIMSETLIRLSFHGLQIDDDTGNILTRDALLWMMYQATSKKCNRKIGRPVLELLCPGEQHSELA